MVKFVAKDATQLCENFGITPEEFDSVEDTWSEVQQVMNDAVEEGFAKQSDVGKDYLSFNPAKLLEIFFEYFDTQEKQDAALIQFVALDIQQRAERYLLIQQRKAMLGVSDLMKDVDLDDLL